MLRALATLEGPAMMVPILLAGGVGTRLWPLSRDSYPKQLLDLAGDRTLLQQAAARALRAAPADRVITVTTTTHRFQVLDQLGDLDPGLARHVLAEPSGRNTAAAAALGALHAVRAFGRDAILWLAAADAYIEDVDALMDALAIARRAAEAGRLVTFGMTPRGPDPTLGYIRRGAPLAGVPGAFAIARFVEKPPRADAEHLIAAGGAYWNSGMFVFAAGAFLDECARTAPDVLDAVKRAMGGAAGDRPPAIDAAAYAAVPSQPIDKAVMERSSLGAVVPCAIGWSDVGDWHRLWEVSAKDAAGNATHGDVVVENSRDTIARADHRLVALAGVRDVVVVETADAVLVADRRDSAGVKAMVDRLKALGRPEATAHLNERRPWGSFAVLLEGPRFKIKEITVRPGARLSLQMHHKRSEHWVVIEGTAKVTSGEEVVTLVADQSTYIPQGTKHRLENPGPGMLRIVEVQTGSYVGEDDIVRFEDSYGRVS